MSILNNGKLLYSAENRLTDKAVYKHLLYRAAKIESRYFIIRFAGNGLPKPRLGFVVAKKKLKLAVSRNRVKRIIRDSFRRNQTALSGLDILVMVKQSIGENFSQLSPVLTRLLDMEWLKICGK